MSSTDSDAEVARGNIITQFMSANVDRRRASSLSDFPRQPIAVEVPKLQNEGEYELLPGRAGVDYIIGRSEDAEDSDNDAFEVRLRSGDIEVVSEAAGICSVTEYDVAHTLPS